MSVTLTHQFSELLNGDPCQIFLWNWKGYVSKVTKPVAKETTAPKATSTKKPKLTDEEKVAKKAAAAEELGAGAAEGKRQLAKL